MTTTLEDVKSKLAEVKAQYQPIADYYKGISDLEQEIADLQAQPITFQNDVAIKQKKSYLPELKQSAKSLVQKQFPSVRLNFLAIPARDYINEQLENDEELVKIKTEYENALALLVPKAVAYNKQLRAKSKELTEEVNATGYDDFHGVLNADEYASYFSMGYISSGAYADLRYKEIEVPSELRSAYLTAEREG